MITSYAVAPSSCVNFRTLVSTLCNDLAAPNRDSDITVTVAKGAISEDSTSTESVRCNVNARKIDFEIAISGLTKYAVCVVALRLNG